MPNPVKWFWKKAGGDAIWDAAKWLWAAGATALTTASQAVWAWVKGHPDLAALAIGCAAVVVFTSGAIVVAVLQKRRSAGLPKLAPYDNLTLPTPPGSSPPAISPNLLPLQKLSVEILEGFVHERQINMLGRPEPWVLLRVRIVNRSDPPVTIKDFDLQLKSCANGESLLKGHRNMIPVGFSYTPTDWPQQTVKYNIDVRLDERTAATPAIFGGQEEGWLLFKTYCDLLHYLFGMAFELVVTDALDGKSRCRMLPGTWLRPAKFEWSPAAI